VKGNGGTGKAVSRGVTIHRPVEEVYRFLRDLENLPKHSQHLHSVVRKGKRSHWVAKAPAGQVLEWDAEIVEEVTNVLLSWRSLASSDIRNSGSVRFSSAPGDRGTEVRVELRYDPPAGTPGATMAKLFGEEPERQLRDDLRRFKQVLETGEVVRSDGSLEGAGQGAEKERPAQPAGAARP
jgi:uncharacterized membrane protein